MGKLLGKIWVGGTVLLISFIGFTSQLFVILPSFPDRRSLSDREVWKLLGPFNALLCLLYWNYALTVLTNPGRVPKDWEPNWKEMELGQAEVKKLTGNARFCRTCQAYKPPRTHHCRQCKTCVLKMDHHCPWVNNCVGHYNQGHFVRFLFYVDLACSYHLWMITKRAFGVTAFQRAPTTFQIIMLILNYTACVPVLLIVGVFSLFHFWNVLSNSTTIEGWEKDKVASLKRRGKIRQYRYPYHLGYLENIKQVFGPNIATWCLPRKMTGDGLTHRVGQGIEPFEQYLWPPRDEFVKTQSRRRTTNRDRPTGSPFTFGTGLNPALNQRLGSTQTATVEEGAATLRHRPRSKPPNVPSSPSRSADSRSNSDTSSSPSILLSDDEEVDSDEIPLGSLAARRRVRSRSSRRSEGSLERDEAEVDGETDEEDLDPYRDVRIRRGSEGYEVRPRFFQPPVLTAALRPREIDSRSPSNDDDDDDEHETDEWQQLEEDDLDEGDPYADELVSEGELDNEGNRLRSQRYKYYVREDNSESDTEDDSEIER